MMLDTYKHIDAIISLLEKQNEVNRSNQASFKNIIKILTDLSLQVDDLEERIEHLYEIREKD